MKRFVAMLGAWLALSAFTPGQEGFTNGLCVAVDPVMRIVKAAERNTAEATRLVQELFPSDLCASVQMPVRLVEKLYDAKDADGSRVEVWSVTVVGADGDKLFYIWAFPLLDPSTDFNFGI